MLLVAFQFSISCGPQCTHTLNPQSSSTACACRNATSFELKEPSCTPGTEPSDNDRAWPGAPPAAAPAPEACPSAAAAAPAPAEPMACSETPDVAPPPRLARRLCSAASRAAASASSFSAAEYCVMNPLNWRRVVSHLPSAASPQKVLRSAQSLLACAARSLSSASREANDA